MAGRIWQSIMDPDASAFIRLPKTVLFQLMIVLALLWLTIFCMSTGLLLWLRGYGLVHVVLIGVGIFGTR